jgi:hypothetical protein
MTLLDKLRERASHNLSKIYVEEWDETIYTTPLTCGEMTKLQKKHGDFFTKQTGEAMADLIILKALDADGNRMMTSEHKPLLMRERITVITSVAWAIVGSQTEGEEAKN